MRTMRIGNRTIGSGHPCFIIAEMSANHCQDFDRAAKIVVTAAEAGADAVKLQTYTPDTITLNSRKEWFIVQGKDNPDLWKGKSLYELYETAYTPWEWHPKLQRVAADCGIPLFSTPFDDTAVDFLETMDVPCYKIASYEVTHTPLLQKVARTKKPVIMSVGFASREEVDEAVQTLRAHGATDIALLHCLTSYAASLGEERAFLATIGDLRERYDVVSGFSDNNGGIELPTIAALSGASIIEKHVILNRRDGGPDAQFSLEPHELRDLVRRIRHAERALGAPHYGPTNDQEAYNLRFRRSIFVAKSIRAGEVFTHEHVRVVRPHDGLHPRYLAMIIGKQATQDIEMGTPLRREHVCALDVPVEELHPQSYASR